MATSVKQVEISRAPATPAPKISGRLIKRAFDLSVGAVLLPLLLPLIALLVLLIRISDGAPAIYRRRVVGVKDNFDAFKLRTMRVDADEVLKSSASMRQEFEVNFKLPNDPRVTRLGAFLRRTSLDELPQLWNVIKGEMSLVGPRMISPPELEKYGDAEWIFGCVKPGLTGHWQVHARPGISYGRRVEMDLFYVRNWSMFLDVKILLRTPARVIRGAAR